MGNSNDSVGKNSEIVQPIGISPGQGVTSVNNSSNNTPVRSELLLEDDEAWKKLFSGKIIETEPTRDIHVVDGKYRYHANDKNKYNGQRITGSISEKIKEEISNNIKSANKGINVKYIEVKASRNPDTKTAEPAVRVVLDNNSKGIDVSAVLDGPICKKYGAGSITLCHPDQTRGLRRRVDKEGTIIYEVANGSFKVILGWYVEGKKCVVEFDVHDNGSVVLTRHNGVTEEELMANKVKVGRQYEAKPLHEVLAQQLKQKSPGAQNSQETSEKIAAINPQSSVTDLSASNAQELQQHDPSSKVASVATPHQHAPAAQVQGRNPS